MNNAELSSSSCFDSKWLKNDLQKLLTRCELPTHWNELLKDGELFLPKKDSSLIYSLGSTHEGNLIFILFSIMGEERFEYLHCTLSADINVELY